MKNLWAELEMRFGSAETITNALLERMHALAVFRESEMTSFKNLPTSALM